MTTENPDALLAEQLAKEKQRADSANAAKTNFLANMSHEIRTPITAVLGMNELILRETKDSTIRQYSRDIEGAAKIEPLEQVIDRLTEKVRRRHVDRLKAGECTIELGFILSDILNNCERISDHCSNIAGCIMDMSHSNMNLHESLREMRESDPKYREQYRVYKEKYALA